MFSYKFKNGSVVNGSLEEIKKIGDILGEPITEIEEVPPGWYPSSTKGLMKIAEMNEVHIKNAINKIAYTYFEEIGKEKDTGEYIKKFLDLVKQPKLNELFTELQQRVAAH